MCAEEDVGEEKAAVEQERRLLILTCPQGSGRGLIGYEHVLVKVKLWSLRAGSATLTVPHRLHRILTDSVCSRSPEHFAALERFCTKYA